MKWAHGVSRRDPVARHPLWFRWLGMLAVGMSAALCAAGASAQPAPGPVWSVGHNNYGQLGVGGTSGSLTPVRTSGLSAATALAAGRYHSLALDDQGAVWAWGYNWVGQLGDGTTLDRDEPVLVTGLGRCKGLGAGNYHSLAIADDGTLWAWGRNAYGELGDGSTQDRATPVRVAGLEDVVLVSAGRFHSVALTGDGAVWTWGRNLNGQLGDGTTIDRVTPVRVSGVPAAAWVAAGYSHTVAAAEDGSVWTWGRNNYGQLGDGSTVDRLSPVRVASVEGVDRVAAGYYHTLAVRGDGTVAAWGRNLEGQLGDGYVVNRLRPVAMGTVTDAGAAAAGSNHTLILGRDGRLWACGYNENGQLGDGTTVNRPAPVRVAGVAGQGYLPNVVAVACGGYHSQALINCTATLQVASQPPQGGTLVWGPQKEVYDYGDLVTVEASPEAGWELSGWSELPSGAAAGGGTAPQGLISFNVLCDGRVAADFVQRFCDVQLVASPGGMVTGDVSGVYEVGRVLAFHAQADAGHRFVAWWVDDQLAGEDADLTLTVEADTTVEALFARQCVLTVVDGAGDGVYDEGAEVEIVADCPAEFFAGWTGDVATVADVLSRTTKVTVNDHLTVTASATARLTIAVVTEDNLDWVYQNTPGCMVHGGHGVALEAVVLEAAGNDAISLAVTKAPGSGPGEVTVADDPSGRPLVRLILGSPRSDGTAGSLVLTVTATGNVWGEAVVSVPFAVRRLGDIDGNGGAEPTDMAMLVMCLNGMAPAGVHRRAFDLDANGGAEPGDMAMLVNILNGIPVG